MANPAELETSERYMAIARRWFAEGWTGNLGMADEIFSEELRTNGVHVGVAGPVARIRDRLAGFPDVSTSIDDMFVSGDKVTEIFTLQDQFTMLKQIGYLPESVHAA
jgi:hypothetical protein